MAISKTVNWRSRTHKETRRPFFLGSCRRKTPIGDLSSSGSQRVIDFASFGEVRHQWYISWICFFHGWKEGCFLKMVMILGQIGRNAFLRDLLFSTLSMATRGNGLRLKQKVQRRFSVVPGWSQAHLICHNVRSCYPIMSITAYFQYATRCNLNSRFWSFRGGICYGGYLLFSQI